MRTGVSTTVVTYDLHGSRSAILFLVLPLTLSLMLLLSSSVEAQYRGGRRPLEKALKRSGLLFIEAGFFQTTPSRDFSKPSGGAASDGSGWRFNIGTWFGNRFTGEVEWGRFNNDRYILSDPWNLLTWPNITGMDFRNSYLVPIIRYYLLPDRRVIPYILGGMGKIRSEFIVRFTQGNREYEEVMSQKSTFFSFGAGMNVVIADHATIVAEWRSYDWFNDALLPGVKYWAVSRLGLGFSWHF